MGGRDELDLLRAAFEASTRHAVLVGVSSFAHADAPELHPPLRCAEADARALSGLLLDPCCGAVDFSRLLLGPQATTAAVMDALEDLTCAERVGPDHTVIIYLSTHGFLDRNEQAYLALHDSDPERPFRTALRMQRLSDLVRDIPARHVVLIIDACHAGSAMPSPERDRRLRTWFRELDRLGNERGERVVLASCAAGEVSLEPEGARHGLFTQHLLRGLRGAADPARRGFVTAVGLYDHVHAEVSREAATFEDAHGDPHRQNPTLWTRVEERLPLTLNPCARPTPGRIEGHDAARLILLDGTRPRARFRLGERTTLGRHPDCDVQLLGDRALSRDHATVVRVGDGWRLDVAAPDRTWLNGRAATRSQPLEHGDVLRVGETELQFLAPGALESDHTEAGLDSLLPGGPT